MNKILTIAAVSMIVVSLSALSGCGTVRGFGSDVSSAGHGIQRAAS